MVYKPLGLEAYGGLFPKLAAQFPPSDHALQGPGEGPFFKGLLRIPTGVFTPVQRRQLLQDLLSYSRLMALGLSGAIISQVVNFFGLDV